MSSAPIESVQPVEFLYTFQASVAENMPLFTFNIIETEVKDSEFYEYKYTIKISCQELAEYTPQIIEVLSYTKWMTAGLEHCIDLLDINFDGYADIQAATGAGTVNIAYSFYRWHAFADCGAFEKEPFFDFVTTGYELYPETKQIISTSRDNAVNHPR